MAVQSKRTFGSLFNDPIEGADRDGVLRTANAGVKYKRNKMATIDFFILVFLSYSSGLLVSRYFLSDR